MQIEIEPKIVLEKIADAQHRVWAKWMTYLFENSATYDGQVVIPKRLVDRWVRQINTPYNELSEAEKDSDRDIALVILNEVFENFFSLIQE